LLLTGGEWKRLCGETKERERRRSLITSFPKNDLLKAKKEGREVRQIHFNSEIHEMATPLEEITAGAEDANSEERLISPSEVWSELKSEYRARVVTLLVDVAYEYIRAGSDDMTAATAETKDREAPSNN
jgi:hypothetical protein